MTPAPRLNPLKYLVIARPQHNSRIISDSSHLVYYFLFDIAEKSIGAGVYGVTEHEIMENHDPLSRCHLEKLIGLVLSATPKPNHVEIGLNSIVEQMFNGVFGREFGVDQPGVHHIRRNVVSTLAVYRMSIDTNFEIDFLLVELDCSDSINYPLLVNNFPILQYCHLEFIHVGLANAIGPP